MSTEGSLVGATVSIIANQHPLHLLHRIFMYLLDLDEGCSEVTPHLHPSSAVSALSLFGPVQWTVIFTSVHSGLQELKNNRIQTDAAVNDDRTDTVPLTVQTRFHPLRLITKAV